MNGEVKGQGCGDVVGGLPADVHLTAWPFHEVGITATKLREQPWVTDLEAAGAGDFKSSFIELIEPFLGGFFTSDLIELIGVGTAKAFNADKDVEVLDQALRPATVQAAVVDDLKAEAAKAIGC